MARYSLQTPHDAGAVPHAADPEVLTEVEEEKCPEPKEAHIKTSDREELIQCIKRGQRPTWVPKPGLQALCADSRTEGDGSRSSVAQPGELIDLEPSEDAAPQHAGSPPIGEEHDWCGTDALRRSLSALHTGDFHQHSERRSGDMQTPARRSLQSAYSISPPSWLFESPRVGLGLTTTSPPSDTLKRTRAPSLGGSLSSSFVMRVPTSPLVHAINNTSLDVSPTNSQSADARVPSMARSRTMPPNDFEALQMSPIDDIHAKPNGASPPAHREGLAAFQGHRTRRSLTSFTYQPAASPQSVFSSNSRRPSLASDASPRQRASMVGSFEESILRGRMSTPPSKPLDFVAQIGVVGKGDCPASLRCPAHVTVPFPAVFYNYPSATTSRSISDDNPSPYVGVIDLEHNLQPPQPPSRRTRRSRSSLDPNTSLDEIDNPTNTPVGRALTREAPERNEKIPMPVKVPPGGAYRVPQKGQLQIIIKNPNKTAVKLFLIPYDLEGMSPGTKTFVRQRSFSSGPILEATMPEQQANLAARDPLSKKDILRYLIHLKFCSTAKGRFYLYDNIRVVFANRVPDGKERLRNEVQLPDPRFSPYRQSTEASSRSPSLADGGYSPQGHVGISPDFGNLENSLTAGASQHQSSRPGHSASLPFHLPPRPVPQYLSGQNPAVWTEEVTMTDAARDVSPVSGFLPSTSSRSSPIPLPQSNEPSILRGFSPAPVEAGDGLISRKLRELLNNAGSEQNN
ncbi:hypothetical protein A1O1_00075 [Capronia coronata CBS 617.96]|uniref:Atos-like conserved domain-containing protein n=1 Tax=Capronia coronata CBS 617.96 TaxID=1182541 RepID=W9YPX4_9EURO|nr:uncharacterized protein A1O1_00075 [Capronia coronata CBS 617.96]EXJ94957.1 hypothetical protein A1O1_00075 [Capronia coronata CBS 617.96]